MAKGSKKPIGSGIPNWRERMVAATFAVVKAGAGDLEGAMKTGGGWKDRTGNARQGLWADAVMEMAPTGATIHLQGGHSMEYGLYLETHKGTLYGQRRNFTVQHLSDPQFVGPLAAVWPAVDLVFPKVDAAVKRLWSTPHP